MGKIFLVYNKYKDFVKILFFVFYYNLYFFFVLENKSFGFEFIIYDYQINLMKEVYVYGK